METGTSVGPYKIIRHLGSGGMGAVWLAEDTRLHRQVALKMVRPADAGGAEARERLMREARAAASLNHPHIATVHDVLDHEDQVIIVLEYVEGETLHSRIKRGPVPPTEAVDIAIQMARALSTAHSHGIVHRDLKPANVIISGAGHAKVLDFGLARLLDIGSTQTLRSRVETAGVVGFVGTPGYAAPEQMVSSGVDERADLYALGVVLFEMISGHRPFPGNDPLQLATAKLSQAAPPLSSSGTPVPPALERLVAQLLERDPVDRPAFAADVVTQLRDIYGAPSTGALADVRPSRFWKSLAAVALITVLAGFGAWALGRFSRPPIDPSAPPVIAVLPLANDSGDPTKDYVAAGIAESLISSLASLPSVTVLSRAAVAEARSRVKDEAAMAKDLGATYVVNGSVQESNGTLKISLHLVKPDRTVAWGDSVEGAFDRIFELQSRLATSLSTALVIRVSASERERISAQPTDSPEALAAYWRGQALLERRDVAGNVDAAIAGFSDAIRLDDRFSLAHAALGAAYWAKYLETLQPELIERAVEAGTSASRIDPDQPEVRYALAVTLAGRGRNAEAIDELHRALAMRPNYDDARRQLGLVLGGMGRIDESVAEYQKALALRPNSASTYRSMGLVLYEAGRYEDAIAAFTKATELQPDNFMGFQQLGTAYHALGKADLALQNYERATAIRPSASALSNMGTLYYGRGEFGKAVDAYRDAITLRPNSATTHRNLGDALGRLGRQAEARAAYQRAVALSEADLKVKPSDPRLVATLAVHLRKSGASAAAQARIADAVAKAPKDIEVLYRAAVINALDGKPDEAIRFLRSAIESGYSRAVASEDDDFASLKGRPEFKALVTSPKP
ncbi:MAG: tetratricopeptide repeat protein [Vicinamibacterales bacterium]